MYMNFILMNILFQIYDKRPDSAFYISCNKRQCFFTNCKCYCYVIVNVIVNNVIVI